MSKLQKLSTQVEKAQAEIMQRENRLKELIQKQKAEERKARTHRLCNRMGLFEKLLPDTITLTDEQFYTFLEKAVANDYGKRTLATIIKQGAETPPPKSETPQPKPAAVAPVGNIAGVSQADQTKRSAG